MMTHVNFKCQSNRKRIYRIIDDNHCSDDIQKTEVYRELVRDKFFLSNSNWKLQVSLTRNFSDFSTSRSAVNCSCRSDPDD